MTAQSTPVPPPPPIGPLPSARQLAWQHMEMYAFLHFGQNTFSNREWGLGNEANKAFQPTELDCGQWARVLSQTGFKGMIITAKHHDGFCLWPTAWTHHSVKYDTWDGGKGDVVRSAELAAHQYGLKFGVYLSPWDRNQPAYGTPEYNQIYAAQLTELCSNYGPLFEVWFDGANGEGPNGKHQVYDWPLFHQVVRQLQPNACMFSDAGPDCRWVGNEQGFADATNWANIDNTGQFPGTPKTKYLPTGQENGPNYIPIECDVSIRPGWFYHPEEDTKVKSVADLMNIWYRSVGNGANLILNVPPDRTGHIHGTDVTRLQEFAAARKTEFAHPLKPTSITSAADRGLGYEAWRVDKDGKDGYWAMPDGQTTGTVELQFGKEVEFNRIQLKEDIALGQRIAKFTIEAKTPSGWTEVPGASGTTVGVRRFLRFPTFKASAIRIRIDDARACPTLSCFKAFLAPDTYTISPS